MCNAGCPGREPCHEGDDTRDGRGRLGTSDLPDIQGRVPSHGSKVRGTVLIRFRDQVRETRERDRFSTNFSTAFLDSPRSASSSALPKDSSALYFSLAFGLLPISRPS